MIQSIHSNLAFKVMKYLKKQSANLHRQLKSLCDQIHHERQLLYRLLIDEFSHAIVCLEISPLIFFAFTFVFILKLFKLLAKTPQ